MTLIAAIMFGLISGWRLQRARRAAVAALLPWLAVLGFQTWLLGSGRGNHPASTVREAGYWIIQVVLLGICLGIAAAASTLRARRTEGQLRKQPLNSSADR